MAYLKAIYTYFFFISLLNSVIGSETKTREYIYEAKKRKLDVKVADIYVSTTQYMIHNNSLVYPLIGIKNVGINAVQKILIERNNGIFKNYHDCIARLNKVGINKKIIESCIMAGAMDCFKLSRATMLASLDDAIRFSDIIMIEDEHQLLLDYTLATPPA